MGLKRPVLYTHRYDSPVGGLYLGVDRKGAAVYVGYREDRTFADRYNLEPNPYACGEVAYQLDEFFRGTRRRFTVELVLEGTEFQLAVWNRLLKIAYGSVATYGEIAQKIGRRSAARAVGNAVARNRLPILIPCHRVLPASGAIGNYALHTLGDETGTKTKEFLLDLERRIMGEEDRKAQ